MKLDFDKEFIEKLIKKDQQAFNEFYLNTVDMFFRYVKSNFFIENQDAEDIISDFYVKWWWVVKKYDFKKSFNAFVRTVFKNLLKDYFKKNKELSFWEIETINWETFEENIVDDFSIEELLESSFKMEKIENAMKKLNNEEREIIYLKFIEEKGNWEISEIMRIGDDNLRQKISRSLKKLKVLLESNIT